MSILSLLLTTSSKVTTRLILNLPNWKTSLGPLQKGINTNNLSIPTVTESEVLELIRSLPSHVATGLDGLSSHLLKIIAPAIAPSLTKIFNCSLINGTVPTELKLARVTPIHKQGIKANPDNYRSISVLSVLSKILEKHVCKHLMAYFTEHGLLHKYQSGFRTNHSCETILLKLTDDRLEAMDKGLFTGVVMIDLCKTFDVVDNALLLRKLEIYGLDFNTPKWF
jgi:hypothetical protein